MAGFQSIVYRASGCTEIIYYMLLVDRLQGIRVCRNCEIYTVVIIASFQSIRGPFKQQFLGAMIACR